MGRTFSVEERVDCALWGLVTGDSYRSCASVFGMGKSTAIGIVKQFLKAMRKHKDRFIKFPYTKEEVKQKMEEFKCLSKFPNVASWSNRRVSFRKFLPLKKTQLTTLTGNNYIA